MLHGSATSPVADTLQPPTGGEFRRANPLSPRWVRTPWAPARSDQPLVTTLGPAQEGFVAWASRSLAPLAEWFRPRSVAHVSTSRSAPNCADRFEVANRAPGQYSSEGR
jgi:hypothetical protein